MLTLIKKETPDIVLISETKLNYRHKVHYKNYSIVFPVRLKEKYTFFMNGKVSEILAGSTVLDKYSDSDHLYVLHKFKARKTRTVSKFYRYVTKDMSPEEFLSRFDDTLKKEDFNAAIGEDGAEPLQKSIEGTCEGMLRNRTVRRAASTRTTGGTR